MVDGKKYIYFGGGLVTPGVGGFVTYSGSSVVEGWSIAGQASAISSKQIGYSFGAKERPGCVFSEAGFGGSWPTIAGASVTAYYVIDKDVLLRKLESARNALFGAPPLDYPTYSDSLLLP